MGYPFVDCFSGAGGLSLGLTRAGFRHAAAFDNNPWAIETYKRNISETAYLADLRTLSGSEVLAKSGLRFGNCDLVAGGPPCQGFSVQGKADPNDPRNTLIFEFLRLVGEIRPRAFLMENVSALASARWRPILDRFKREADALGYQLAIAVLNAADFGVAQSRKRLFIVGRDPARTGAFAFPKPSRSPDEYATVRDAIGNLPPPSLSKDILSRFPNHEPDNISDLNRKRIMHVPQGGGREDIPPELRLPCHSVSVAVAGHRGVYGRLHWDMPAGTVTTKCNSFTRGRFAHPEEHRNISMREAARLQSFPDSFAFLGNRVDVAHQIGNAVPPKLAYHIAAAIRACLEGLPPKKESSQAALEFDCS